MSQEHQKLDYATALSPLVSEEELPGFRRVGIWKSVRIVAYATILAGAVLVSWLLAGMK